MGDIFFFIRTTIYTVIFIVLMQVKIGPTTLEQKVIEFTHHSQLASRLQKVAQGGAAFIGVQYKKATSHLGSKYIEQHSSAQRPGDRLQLKMKELKESINSHWEETENQIKEEVIQN